MNPRRRLHALIRRVVAIEMEKAPRSRTVQADGLALLACLKHRRATRTKS